MEILLRFGSTAVAGAAAAVGDSNVGRIVWPKPTVVKDEERVVIEVESEDEGGEGEDDEGGMSEGADSVYMSDVEMALDDLDLDMDERN